MSSSAAGSSVEDDKHTKALKRVRGLIARAAHEGTPEEEARTSALVAARMIHAEKLLEPRHPLFDRLEGLDDETLDELGGLVENVLEGVSIAREEKSLSPSASRWRAEANHLQRQLDAFAGSLRWILQGYKIGLVERPGYCGYCHEPLKLGEMVVWKRRRIDAAHYMCCVVSFQQQGAIPRS